jgi:hypothetical protein
MARTLARWLRIKAKEHNRIYRYGKYYIPPAVTYHLNQGIL